MHKTLLAALLAALLPAAFADTACERYRQKHAKDYVIISCVDDNTAVITDKNGKNGLADAESGAILVPLDKYNFIYSYPTFKAADGSLRFKVDNKDRKQGMIDGKGKELLPLEYDFVWLPEKAGNPVYIFQNNADGGLVGIADENGKVLQSPRYHAVKEFSEGMAAYADRPLQKYGEDDDNVRYGYLDAQGNSVIAPRFKVTGNFADGVAWVKDEQDDILLIDRAGNVRFRAPYRLTQHYAFSNGYATAQQDGNLYGLLDKDGNVALSFEYQAIIHAPPFTLLKKDHKWGAMNGIGNLIVPFEYDSYTDMRYAWEIRNAAGEAGKQPNEKLSLVRGGTVFVFDGTGKQLSTRPAKFAKQCAHVERAMEVPDGYFVTDIFADKGMARVEKLFESDKFFSCTDVPRPKAAKAKTRGKKQKRR